MTRSKLTIDEQITDMQAKGITFLHSDKDDAKRFLKYNTYYFKIKVYERNYDKYNTTSKKGQYINLDCLLKRAFYFRHVFEKNCSINGLGYRTCLESTTSL